MKKILIGIMAVLCLAITGCGKVETKKLEKKVNDWSVSIDVPKDKNYKFYEDGELKDTPEYAPYDQTFILAGDKIAVYFEYNYSSDKFKDFIKDRGENEKIIKYNGRDAVKTEYKYGDGSGELVGYQYLVSMDDMDAYMSITILPKNEKDDIKKLVEDKEVKVIIDSIKINEVK